MAIWMNWGLVLCGIACVFGDLVLEVYPQSKLALLGMAMIGGGILGVGLGSTTIGLGLAAVLVIAYVASRRRRGHLAPKHVSGH